MGTSILLSLGLLLAVIVIIISAFIAYATLMRIVHERAKRHSAHEQRDQPQDDSPSSS